MPSIQTTEKQQKAMQEDFSLSNLDFGLTTDPEKDGGTGKHRRADKMPTKCPLHTNVVKKSFIKKILAGDHPDSVIQYASTVGHLTLSHLTLPDGLASLTDIFPKVEALSLTKMDLRSLSGIERCSHLKHLLLPGNHLKEIPESLAHLAGKLEALDLSDSAIEHLPPFLMRFSRLKVLRLSNCLIRQLPEDFGNLRNLEVLFLRGCLLTHLPHTFRRLQVL